MKRTKSMKFLAVLLCTSLLMSISTSFLSYADGFDDPESMGWAQCPYCDEWSPPGEFCPDCGCCVDCYYEHHCFNCSACMEEAACPDCLCCEDCLNGPLAEYHCQDCGACFYDDGGGIGNLCPECGCCEDCGNGFCPGCGRCHNCIGEEEYCPDCGCCHDCLGGGNYCAWCGRCSDCAGEICPDCYCCEDCQEEMGTHCSICGQCLEAVGHCVNDSTEWGHCSDCCIICDQCGECMIALELEQCPYCGLCEECCRQNSEDAGCDCGICIESPEWEDHICPECETPFCQADHEQCPYCGLCEECCRQNSEDAGCDCGICIESPEWKEHICPQCGEPFCQVDQCDYCGLCVDCCRENTENEGCDCGICIESPDWFDHICPDCGTPFCQTDHEQCEYCGLCAECCKNKSQDKGCSCGICIESPDWFDHICPDCGIPFCQIEKCGYCGLCLDCCRKNSACSEHMCIMNPEYESHICVDCGRCFHDSPACESCLANGEYRCRECCRTACEAMGCDCGDRCVSDPGFQEHLDSMHSGSGTHEYVPRSDWSFDEEKHWKSCRYCDDPAHISELAEHSFDSNGVCTVCGYSEGSCQGYIIRQPRDAHCQVSDWYARNDAPESMNNNKVTFTVKAGGAEIFMYRWILISGHYNDDGSKHDDSFFWFDDDEDVYYSNNPGLADWYDNSAVTGEEPYIVASGCNSNTLTLSVPASVCCKDRYFRVGCDVIFGHDDDENSTYTDEAYIIGTHRFTERNAEALPDKKPTYWIWGPEEYGGPFRSYENAGHRLHCCSECCGRTRIVPHEYEETGVEVDSDYLQLKCKVCGHISYIPKPRYTWYNNNTTCYVYRVFVPAVADTFEESLVAAGNVEEEEAAVSVTSEITKPATCTENGIRTFTAIFDSACTWAETQVLTEEIPAIGHDWSETEYIWSDDYTECTARRVCLNEGCGCEEKAEADVTIELTEPSTCSDMGSAIYTATFNVDWAEEISEEIANIPINPDAHDWGETEYIWSDDYSECTAIRVCENDDSHIEESHAVITTEVLKPASCTEKGLATYTAVFDRDWAEEQELTAELPELGHYPGYPDYSWSDDHKACIAKRVCLRRGCEYFEESEAEVTVKVTEPSCTKKGSVVYTASFGDADWAETQIYTEELPLLEHEWIYITEKTPFGIIRMRVCKHCGYKEPDPDIPKTKDDKAVSLLALSSGAMLSAAAALICCSRKREQEEAD